jgi:hypothetical protein
MAILRRSGIPALLLGIALNLAAVAAEPTAATAPIAPNTASTPSGKKDGYDLLAVPALPDSWSAHPSAAPTPAPLLPPLPRIGGNNRPAAALSAQPLAAPPSLTPRLGWPGKPLLLPLPSLTKPVQRAPGLTLWPTPKSYDSKPGGAPTGSRGSVPDAPAQSASGGALTGKGVIFLEEEEEAAAPRAPAHLSGDPQPWSLAATERRAPLPPPRAKSFPVFGNAPSKPPSIPPPQAPTPSVDLRQLKQQVQAAAGRLALRVEVQPGPEGVIHVRVVTLNATAANYLAERILQLPEMNSPQIRLDLQVGP